MGASTNNASGHFPHSLVTKWWPWLAAALSGFLLALCYPRWNLTGFIWIWQAPLLGALWFSRPVKVKTARWKRGFGLGYVSGFVFFAIDLSWLFQLKEIAGSNWGGVGAVLGLSGYLALYFGAFGVFASTLGRWIPREPKGLGEKKSPGRRGAGFLLMGRGHLFDQSVGVLKIAFLNGAAWCGLEWLRGVLFTGFGWNTLGVALKELLMLVQFAEVIGVIGFGFVLMFSGCILFTTLVRMWREVSDRRRVQPHLDFAVGVAMIVGLFLFGFQRVVEKPKRTIDLRARIMQMNISLEEKMSSDPAVLREGLLAHRDLTRAFVETGKYDLVVWPETSIPGVFSSKWMQDYLNNEILKGGDFYLLAGLEESDFSTDQIFNTITLMKGNTQSYQMYKKIHLVPFGEMLPLRGKFPVFEWILGNIVVEDFTPGTSHEPLTMKKGAQLIKIIPLICFEDTMGRFARKFIRSGGPQLMVNVTNDGWFFDSAASEQHFANALFRCIELRRPMIRAANTGVSGFIDERGSVYDRYADDGYKRIIQDEVSGSTNIRGSLPGTLKLDLNPPTTVYARIGDTFSIVMGMVALIFSIRGIARTQKGKTA